MYDAQKILIGTCMYIYTGSLQVCMYTYDVCVCVCACVCVCVCCEMPLLQVILASTGFSHKVRIL